MNDIAIFLEHVDFLDRLNRLDIELFKRRLQLFIICARRLVDLLHFSSRCPFTTSDKRAVLVGADRMDILE